MKIGVYGASGRIGKLLLEELKEGYKGLALSSVFVRQKCETDFSSFLHAPLVTNDLKAFVRACECVIDFSLPKGVDNLLEALLECPKILVSGTTGLEKETLEKMQQLALKVPLLHAHNMSLGIMMLNQLAFLTSLKLKDADIEIIETHHNLKKDAPSGTALSLYETCAKARGYDEKSALTTHRGGLRSKESIGIAALRGGDVAGKHTIGFYLEGEYIELSHTATNRSIFAKGALEVALWLKDKAAKKYEINEMFG
ncbi:4-hydroxy-tetrahydrodipicolinate reductase [Helicobacter pylori]|uniref:4-hydroxy-tetrahydrodipicolinate reductase n=1 Tax=Helicobacter pylori TaxID=210 RepID=UPI00042EC7D1|nr:4-hydroxy-tetrahydrodipicolinate reductase [Helicobacter pylori]AHN36327.1 dihydrodipicolinate reductase [Helicobacter pylori oki112]AHN40629.1 dihydrodipicolinate reductase [Helicobacter pylori oki422]AHN44994.1 dihydrodipicolinate reductase [Helicobacter pylori oki898]WRC32606.1 4-hydroxy-tetrahydrodipicolinate reductase [Helicobacter pylori]